MADKINIEWTYVWTDTTGKTRAGRLLDGIEHNAMPEVAS